MKDLIEKRKAEEARRKKEQELQEELKNKEEELKKEGLKDSSRRSINTSKQVTGRGEKEEEKALEPPKTPIEGERPPSEQRAETPSLTEVKKEGTPAVQEDKKEEEKAEELVPKLNLPKPCRIPVNEDIMVGQVTETHHLVLKKEGNIVAGELMVLPTVVGKKDKKVFYEEFAATHPRLKPQKAVINVEESEGVVLEAEQVPTHIQSYFVDTYNPLTAGDWDAWMKTIVRLDGVGYMAIPPLNIKWDKKMDACVMHVLPLPNEGVSVIDTQVPIDAVFASMSNYERQKKEPESRMDEGCMFTLCILTFVTQCS